MKKYLIITLLLISPTLAFADNVSVPSQLAVDALQDTLQTIGQYQQAIANLQNQLAENQAALLVAEQRIVQAATNNPPFQPAVDYCNANPDNCPGYTPAPTGN